MAKKNMKRYHYSIMYFGKYGFAAKGVISHQSYLNEKLVTEIYNSLGDSDILLNIIYMGEVYD